MDLSDSVSAAVSVLRRRPSDLLPLYLLGAAIPAIVRLVPFVGLLLGYVYLDTTGRLAAIRDHLASRDLDPPDPEANPDAFEEWVSGFEPIVDLLITPETRLLVLATALVSVVALAVLSAIVSAAQIAGCYGRLRDERGLIAGLSGGRRYWLRFLGLYLLEVVLWALVAGAVVAATVLVGGVAGAAIGPAALLVVLPFLLLGLLLLVPIRATFAFAPVAVVVDNAGVFGSLSRALGFIRRHPIAAVFYYMIAVGSVIGVLIVTGLLAFVEVASIVGLAATLVLTPFLDLLKTGLYTDSRGRLEPPEAVDRSLRDQFADGVRAGWAEMLRFVRSTPLTHAFVVALAVGSFWVGWELAGPYAGTFDTSISGRLDGHIPPTAAVNFFANNWLVAITTAYAGFALVVPALASLAFNGLVMGVYAQTEVAPTELAAFVAPHGIFEIPAILVATALGISLGAVAARVPLGQASRSDIADALERAFWVLVGIGLLLAIAGFIEGFVSPYYFRLFL
ncbi:stage II sporulation protein M [Halosolutus gelatinilyticus]|uniref:stage II sporulation protein M n=1 Tax=Halosolutus gelatinilyticus TaxID=2931975 RepID=UPI001FF12621|nr:stage II sporulation protein M [Halosolutus gelatinilyticus]